MKIPLIFHHFNFWFLEWDYSSFFKFQCDISGLKVYRCILNVMSVLQLCGQIVGAPWRMYQMQQANTQVTRTKGSRTSYSKDHFNGPKYSEQLSVHSCKRKKNEKIWQNSSHLEFHSIFNQDGITNSPKNLQFQRAKRVKLAHLLRSLKTCSSVTENVLNI